MPCYDKDNATSYYPRIACVCKRSIPCAPTLVRAPGERDSGGERPAILYLEMSMLRGIVGIVGAGSKDDS